MWGCFAPLLTFIAATVLELLCRARLAACRALSWEEVSDPIRELPGQLRELADPIWELPDQVWEFATGLGRGSPRPGPGAPSAATGGV